MSKVKFFIIQTYTEEKCFYDDHYSQEVGFESIERYGKPFILEQEEFNELVKSVRKLNTLEKNMGYTNKLVVFGGEGLSPEGVDSRVEELEKEIEDKKKAQEAAQKKRQATRRRNSKKKKREQLEKLKKELGES